VHSKNHLILLLTRKWMHSYTRCGLEEEQQQQKQEEEDI
jgi:hypothetical protein